MASILRLAALSLSSLVLLATQNATAGEDDPFGCAGRGSSSRAVSECNRTALFNLTNQGLHTLSYKGARERMFQFVDVRENEHGRRVVDCVYTGREFEVGNGGIPQNGVNTEHTWPQSFLKTYPRYDESVADLHHLFPVYERENSRRSNYSFTECPGEPGEGELPGERCSAGYEVPEWHKGVAARAMFYVSVTYKIPLGNEQEAVLRAWNAEFPPTDAERERDEKIFQVQRNHNPFVGHPEWVDLVSDF